VLVRALATSTRTALGVVLALAALLLVTLEGSAATGRRVLQKATKGEVETLAMDGVRIAYDVGAGYGSKQRCNTVYVWNVRRGTTTRLSGRETCGADTTSTGAGVRELALAGGRAAWIVNQGGNSESADYLYTAVVASPRERVLAAAYRTGNIDQILTGNWIGGLVGGGSFLGVNRWATDTRGAVTSARLQHVGARLSELTDGTATMVAQATDGKQVAVLRADGAVALYSTHGRLLRVVSPSSATDVGLRGDYLVVLTKTRTLEVYNSHSGKRLRSWRVARRASGLDVSSGLAVYAAPSRGGQDPHTVHVVRLATGRDRIAARASGEVTGVQLEPAGLAYAVNRARNNDAVVFVPMGRLPR
jgi:hypothetical protein